MASRRRRKSSSSMHDSTLDCTSKCQLYRHAHVVLKIAALGNLELLKHCSTLCANPWSVSDETGRTALHMAASNGSLEVLEWLLRRKGRQKRINCIDVDSHWTALHRSAYFGYPGNMVALMKAGASLDVLDKDGWSPLNILHSNFNIVDAFPVISEVSLYLWGSNVNMTLGHDRSRSNPELLEVSPALGNVSQVILCKFHTLILTERGEVYSCGHGTGGRLGHGNENTVVSPKVIDSMSQCIEIAAARNHSVFLTEDGLVFTCGINDAQQLGHAVKTSVNVLSPLLVKALKSKTIKLIGAGRYHTAVATLTQVFSFGKNLGQLGYQKSSNMQPTPRNIPGILVDEGDTIDHLSVSDAATACITSRRHQIFICTNYTVLRCERYNFPDSLSISQFVVCASLGELEHKQKKKDVSSSESHNTGTSGSGLMIALLDSDHKLWFSHWAEYSKKGCVSPRVILGGTKFSIAHFSLTKNLTIATTQGEVYTGAVTATTSLMDLSRIALVQQATKVFTDFKATNMAFLQNVYNPLELPLIESSTFKKDIYSLLSEIDLPQSVADVKLHVNGSVFSTNSLLLSSNSSVFSSLFSSKLSFSSPLIQSFYVHDSIWDVTLNCNASSDVFQLFLLCLYGGQVDVRPLTDSSPKSNPLNTTSKSSLDTSGDESSTTCTTTDWNVLYDQYCDEKNLFDQLVVEEEVSVEAMKLPAVSSDVPVHVHRSSAWLQDLESLLVLATSFQVIPLVKRLNHVLSGNYAKGQSCLLSYEPVLKVRSAPHDVILVTEEEKEIKCHKCVLVTRSDYFQSMLLMGWRESSSEETVKRLYLPVPFSLLEMLVYYLYRDMAPQVSESTSPDFLISALIVADQFLLPRLKSICEQSLAKCLSIRNIPNILEFSLAYHAVQLQQTCFQFICYNFPALLEGGALESFTTPTLDLVSCTYQEMFSATRKRKITLRDPTEDELPESYLHNRALDLSESEDEPDSRTLTRSNTTTPTSMKSIADTPTSTSRKKKKRRSNIIREDKARAIGHVIYSPPMSPDPIVPDVKPLDQSYRDESPSVDTNGGLDTTSEIETVTSPCWNRSQSIPDGSSFRAIMQQQEMKARKAKDRSVKPSTTSASKELPKPENNVRRVRSESFSMETPPPANPWGTTPPSAHVSLRELMAAEVEAENQSKRRTTVSQKPVQRSLSYDGHLAPGIKSKDLSQTVSFADIVSDQIKEMDQLLKQDQRKPLHLIQIEEKAIEQLLELYNAENNPDENITIEHCPSSLDPIAITQPGSKRRAKPTSSSVWSVRSAYK